MSEKMCRATYRRTKVRSHRGTTENISIQLPLAWDVILGDLHLKTTRLSIEELHSVERPDNFNVTCFKHKTKVRRTDLLKQ